MKDITDETQAVDRPAPGKDAVLYRMVMPKHVCPYGRKAKWLLERQGLKVDDRWLETRDETDALKDRLGVKTTPQIFIGADRVGGYDALREHFGGHVRSKDEITYQPVIAIFTVAFAIAVALSWRIDGVLMQWQVIPWFVAVAMTFLGVQKLQDVESFSTMFLNYDLLAQRWVPYAYLYAFLETAAGVLMIAGALTWLAVPVMLVIGTIGAVSVFKAVYVDRRKLKCACVGGGANVPLGFVSLSENLAMMAMGLYGLTMLL